MEKIEFAVSGSFEQLSQFKEEAEKLGWKYLDDSFTKEEYELYPLLYFCDEQAWLSSSDNILNRFALSDVSDSVIIFDLDTNKGQALTAIKHSLKKDTKLEEFVDFLVDKYTIEDGDLINDENRVESKEEVIKAFTMVGQTKVV